MGEIFERVRWLIKRGTVKISDHGYDELADDDIFVTDALDGADEAAIIEEYPDYHKGPCVLVLQHDAQGEPIHVVWGIPKKTMRTQAITKLIREGEYAAEVDVKLEHTDASWSPYLSVEDALKLDRVRRALRNEDLEEAARQARVYKLTTN